MQFKGFPLAGIDFFDGLRADNSKTYWNAHKAEYDAFVRGPMEALLEHLGPEFGEAKLYRPYRDVRFSKDKSPYQTHLAAGIADAGGVGGYYLCLKYDCLIVGFGLYDPGPAHLGRIREAIAGPRGAELAGAVDALEADGFVLSGQALKTVPRGFPADHPRVRLLRQKSIVLARSWPPGPWLERPEVADRLTSAMRAGRPVLDWLAATP